MRRSRSKNMRVAWWLTFLSVTLFALFFDAHPAATAFPTAELRIIWNATPPSSAPGGSDVTYAITITNTGPQDATNMVVRIVLADTVTKRLATYTNPGPPSRTENCAYVANSDGRGGTITCSIGTLFLSLTAPATVVIGIRLPTVTSATTIREIGTVTINEHVQVGSNATSSSFNLETLALPIPALSLTIIPPPTPVLAGSRLTYTISVSNSGGTATGVRMTDTLPSNARYTSASFTTGGSAPVVCPGSDGPPRATCEIGTLIHDGTAIVTLVVTTFQAGSATNTAEVIANEAPAPLARQVTTIVLPAANLTVTKLGNPRVSVQLGADLTYTITVLNGGPSQATGVTVTDTLPSSVTFRSGDSRCTHSGGTLREGTLVGGTVTCTIGTMANLAFERINITVRPTVVEPIRNEVTVRGNEADPDPSFNTFALTIPVLGADLSVSQTGGAAGGLISSMTFRMTVTNNGPAGATNVALTDRLPLSIPLLPTSGSPTLVATASQGSCASGTPGVLTVNSYKVLTCAIGNLNPGSSATVTVVISRVPAGSYQNAATVTGTPGDHNLTNNTSATSVTVPSTPLPGAPTPPTPPLPHP